MSPRVPTARLLCIVVASFAACNGGGGIGATPPIEFQFREDGSLDVQLQPGVSLEAPPGTVTPPARVTADPVDPASQEPLQGLNVDWALEFATEPTDLVFNEDAMLRSERSTPDLRADLVYFGGYTAADGSDARPLPDQTTIVDGDAGTAVTQARIRELPPHVAALFDRAHIRLEAVPQVVTAGEIFQLGVVVQVENLEDFAWTPPQGSPESSIVITNLLEGASDAVEFVEPPAVTVTGNASASIRVRARARPIATQRLGIEVRVTDFRLPGLYQDPFSWNVRFQTSVTVEPASGGGLTLTIPLPGADGFARTAGGFGGAADAAIKARLAQAGPAPLIALVAEAQSGPFTGEQTAVYLDSATGDPTGQGFPGPTPVPDAIGVAPLDAVVDGARVQAALTFGPSSGALQPWDDTTATWGATQLLLDAILDCVPFDDGTGATGANTSDRVVFQAVIDPATGQFATQTVVAAAAMPAGEQPVSAWAPGPDAEVHVLTNDAVDAGRLHVWDRTAATLTLVERVQDGARRVRGDGGLVAVSSETADTLRVLHGTDGVTVTAGDGSIGIDVREFGDLIGVVSTGLRDDTWWIHWFEKPGGPGAPVLVATDGPRTLPQGVVAPAHAGFLPGNSPATQATVDVTLVAADHVVIVRDVAIPR